MKKIKLGDVAEYINGYAFKPTDWSENGYTIIRIQDLTGSDYQTNKFNGEIDSKYEVNNGDILISWSATLGIYVWNKGKAYLNQHIFKVVLNTEIVDKWYFYYQVDNLLKRAQSEAHGATMKHLTKEVFNNLPFLLPSLLEQKYIAKLLGRLDELIDKRKQQLENLDKLIKSQFIEMFEKGQQYEETSFGDICIYVRNGANIKQTKGAGGYPITRIETLSNDVFNSDRLGYADITDLSRYTNYLLKKGDILISHINSVAYLGRAVQYRGEVASPVIHGMNLLCARIKEDYNPTYIEWCLKSKRAKDYIATITKKAVNQASITTADLKKMAIPVPPKEEQNLFARFVEQTDKSKVTIEQSLEQLEILKKSLMQKYFG